MSEKIKRLLPLWAFSEIISRNRSEMVMLSGARQVGKTYLVSKLQGNYYNWDTKEVKNSFLKDPYFFRSNENLVIFDEIHKRKDWKKLLKGYFDSPERKENFIITGSGKLEQYQRGGDSLQGRYFPYKLWPIAFDELRLNGKSKIKLSEPRNWKTWEPQNIKQSDQDLIEMGGFPAPLIRGQKSFLNRWQDQYLDRLVKEDVRDFSAVQRLDQMEMLARILPERTTSPISYMSLAQDIDASPVAVKSWLRLFDALYFGMFLKPYHRKIYRAVKREPKWFFLQWTYNEELGSRFENYLAIQLSLACSAWSEQGYGRWELFYLRDQDRREVDFLIARNLSPVVLIEAKSSEQSWPAGLEYYAKKLNIPGILAYPKGGIKRISNLGWSMPSNVLLSGLLAD